MAAAQLTAIPTPAASLFPPPRSQSAERQPKGGSRRPGQAASASPTPRPTHPGRPPALSLPSPAPPRPRCRRTAQSHQAQVPLPSTPPRPDRRRGQATLSAPSCAHAPSPVRAPPSRAPIGCAASAGRGRQRVSRRDWPGGAEPTCPTTPPKPLLSRWRMKNKNYISFRLSFEGRSPSGPARGAPAAEPQGRHERALGRGASLGPCSRLGSSEPPAIGTALRGGGGIEPRPEGVIRPLIRAVRGVLRYSTGGGGTCGVSPRMRTGEVPAPAGGPQAAILLYCGEWG